MPAYAGAGQAKLLRDNSQGVMFANETVPVGTLSNAFLLERINRSFYPWGFSVEAKFTAAPGAFTLYIMGANTDDPGSYIQIGSITVVNASNVGRWDMPSNVWPKFVAGYVNGLANAVNLTMIGTK